VIEKAPWSTTLIHNSLETLHNSSSGEDDLSCLIDRESKIVIGLTKTGRVFFAGPQSQVFEPFHEDLADMYINKRILLQDYSVLEPLFQLECEFKDETELWAISSFFMGLSNLCKGDQNNRHASDAIMGIRHYFQSLKETEVSFQTEVGLFGELIFMLSHENVDEAIMAWHTDPRETYDFSGRGLQLEIKTTTRPVRIHQLKSTQSILTGENNFFYASLYSPLASDGKSVHDVIVELIERASSVGSKNLLSKLDSYETNRMSRTFDLEKSLNSILWFSSRDVPRPQVNDHRIMSVTWSCDFSQLDNVEKLENWYEMLIIQ